jgi:cell division protein FtsL
MNHFLHRGEYQPTPNRAGLLMVVVISVVMGLIFCYVWQKVSLSRQMADIEQLSQSNRMLAERVRCLELEKQQLSFRGRVEELAVSQLGMVYPEKEQIVALIQPPRGGRPDGWSTNLAGVFIPAAVAWGQQ